MPESQSSLVLDALEDGCETTRDIMRHASLTRGVCAAVLSKLRRDGWLTVAGTTRFGGRGRNGFRWKLKRVGSAAVAGGRQ